MKFVARNLADNMIAYRETRGFLYVSLIARKFLTYVEGNIILFKNLMRIMCLPIRD